MKTQMGRWFVVGLLGAAGCGGGGHKGAPSTGAAADGGGVSEAAWLTPPPVPPALVVPAGAALKLHDHAVGAQIYTCTAGDAGTFAWALKQPDAVLYDRTGAEAGTHGAGPHWTSTDGSVASAVKVTELPSPLPDAISWLLLRVTANSGAGVFSDATYVQRLSTTGGRAPATGCDATAVGTEARIPYTADYYFYAGGGAADWLAPPANLPAALAPPAGATLAVHDRGIGVQIYNCTASDGAAATYAWVLKAPDALLYDMTFAPVATHGAGPSWTSSDGSTVTAKLVAQVDSPVAGAIPWLLLGELTESGPGVFGDVAAVLRLNTAGGRAPADGCDVSTVNTVTRVPYSADYYFFSP